MTIRTAIDASVAFRLLSRGGTSLIDLLDPAGMALHAPQFLFVELFKHKERMLRASGLSAGDLVDAVETLVSRIELHSEASLPLGTWMEAYRLCRPVDEKATSYVALTLHLEAELWTDDSQLKTGLRARGFDRFFKSAVH